MVSIAKCSPQRFQRLREISCRRVDHLVGTEVFSQLQRCSPAGHHDGSAHAGDLGGEQSREGERARTQDDDGRIRTRLHRVQHGARASSESAANWAQQLQRHVGGDLDGVALGCQSVGGERRLAEEVAAQRVGVGIGHRRAAVGSPRTPVEREILLTVRRSVIATIRAARAAGEAQCHRITGRHGGDPPAHTLNNSGAFMSQHARQRRGMI